MEYISAKEAAALWGIDPSRIGKLARAGRIKGAKIIGRNWLIPANAEKPLDGRTKTAKESPLVTDFRFPLFINFPENSFAPPLTPEEAALRQGQAAFYSCEFERAKAVFAPLAQNAESIYVKICALFYMCVISVVYNKNSALKPYYDNMVYLLSQDFPHRQDMRLFLPLFDFSVGRFYAIAEKLKGVPAHDYHSSAIYMYAFLSTSELLSVKPDASDAQFLKPYQILCRLAERDGYYIEAQKLHIALFIAFYAAHNEEEMHFHIKRVLDIAYEHNLLYPAADAWGYYADVIDLLLRDYPPLFAEKIRKAGRVMAGNFADFSKKTDTAIYSKLSETDYRFLIYAEKGYSNKQIARICGMSERWVAGKYSTIYNKLGVSSKKELLREIELEMGSLQQ